MIREANSRLVQPKALNNEYAHKTIHNFVIKQSAYYHYDMLKCISLNSAAPSKMLDA